MTPFEHLQELRAEQERERSRRYLSLAHFRPTKSTIRELWEQHAPATWVDGSEVPWQGNGAWNEYVRNRATLELQPLTPQTLSIGHVMFLLVHAPKIQAAMQLAQEAVVRYTELHKELWTRKKVREFRATLPVKDPFLFPFPLRHPRAAFLYFEHRNNRRRYQHHLSLETEPWMGVLREAERDRDKFHWNVLALTRAEARAADLGMRSPFEPLYAIERLIPDGLRVSAIRAAVPQHKAKEPAGWEWCNQPLLSIAVPFLRLEDYEESSVRT